MYSPYPFSLFFFFFNDTATTEIYTLSLHDALPISDLIDPRGAEQVTVVVGDVHRIHIAQLDRSEEHTSERQSQFHLVCRLLLEKKKKIKSEVRSRPSALISQVLRT